MIYVPDTSYSCYVLVNKDTIRAYEQTPFNPGYNQQITINYRDYYITSSYLFVDGSQSFGNYSQIPVCLQKDILTDAPYYRQDFDKVMISFTCIFLIMIFLFGICLKSLLRGLFK